jgi:hypothetical protein
VVAAARSMDAMGYIGPFFVLAFLGREKQKVGSAPVLSGFPLKIFECGQ